MSSTSLDDVLRAIDTYSSRREFDAVYRAVAARFGRRNDWELTKDEFALGHIGLDRRPRRRRYAGPSFNLRYRDKTSGCFAAIVEGNQYTERDEPWDRKLRQLEHYRREYNVQWHMPPVQYSGFWWPTRERFICFTRPGVVVNWLPEQITPSALFQEISAANARASMARPTLVTTDFAGSYH